MHHLGFVLKLQTHPLSLDHVFEHLEPSPILRIPSSTERTGVYGRNGTSAYARVKDKLCFTLPCDRQSPGIRGKHTVTHWEQATGRLDLKFNLLQLDSRTGGM